MSAIGRGYTRRGAGGLAAGIGDGRTKRSRRPGIGRRHAASINETFATGVTRTRTATNATATHRAMTINSVSVSLPVRAVSSQRSKISTTGPPRQAAKIRAAKISRNRIATAPDSNSPVDPESEVARMPDDGPVALRSRSYNRLWSGSQSCLAHMCSIAPPVVCEGGVNAATAAPDSKVARRTGRFPQLAHP